MNILGLLCPNLSTIPSSPKSGEQDVKIPPIEEVASIAIIVSGQLGNKVATLSPTSIPFPFNHKAKEKTFFLSSDKVIILLSFPSP